MVAVEFARFLGLPVTARANLSDITNSVCAVLCDVGCDLILVDEIHNLTWPPARAQKSLTNGWSQPAGPIDVSALPMIRAAQRRHHRLIHRHGAQATGRAMRSAVAAWDRMHHYRSLGRHDWERIGILRPGADTVGQNDPLAHAVRYPEIVIIAGVLASPEWQTTAAARREAAFAEIARRVALDGYSWQPHARHPLSHWANDNRPALIKTASEDEARKATNRDHVR
jgi:hypothetical protein